MYNRDNMEQTLSCPKCGSQNVVGQRFCGACGQELRYGCSRCGTAVAPTSRFCANCGQELGWGTQQPTQPLPVGQKTYYEPPSTHGYGRREPQQKETSSAYIGYLGLIIGIVLLVGGGIFAINSGFDRTSSSAPPAISEPADISPVPAQTLVSEPDEEVQGQELGCETLPEYVQQYENVQPPCARASGERIHLVSNPDAKDVSFAELRSFILEDDTDEATYIEGVRICGDFAETLHNNAERAGIRAAFVGIDFVDEEIGHALNAFCTLDRGLVYVDCQGPGQAEPWQDKTYDSDTGQDKIAYIEGGKEYGLISINKAESLQYSFYIEHAQNCQRLADMLEDYENEVDAYNRALGGRYSLPEPEYSRFRAWADRLDSMEEEFDELSDSLGGCWESGGMVETIEIYW